MVHVQKWPFFQTFFCLQYRAGKCLLRYFTAKKLLSSLQKQEVKKVEKLIFLQRGLLKVYVQKWPLFQPVFLGNIFKENVFHHVLAQKIAFLGYRNKKFKRRKIDIFPKGLNHGFGPKMAIFTTFFVRQYRPGKCLLCYSRTKKFLSRL